ncbi:MAG: trypsin-like serine protease [Deinococcota bacterium]
MFQLLPSAAVATVIDKNWAVTASHCLILLLENNFEKQPFEVVVNGFKNTIVNVAYPTACSVLDDVRNTYKKAIKEGQDVTSGVFLEPVLSKLSSLAGASDIALLQFANPVTDVEPLPLYDQQDEVGQKAIMLGWGAFSTGDKGIFDGEENYDGCFRHTENRISQIRNGMLAFTFDRPSSKEVLPLEGVNGPGDSGGPLLLSTSEGIKIAGVSSYSSCLTEELDKQVEQGERAMQLYDTIEHYARISDHVNWLRSIIN